MVICVEQMAAAGIVFLDYDGKDCWTSGRSTARFPSCFMRVSSIVFEA